MFFLFVFSFLFLQLLFFALLYWPHLKTMILLPILIECVYFGTV